MFLNPKPLVCVRARARVRVRVRVRAQKMACGCVRRTLRILCDVRAGAGQKVRTLKVWIKALEIFL